MKLNSTALPATHCQVCGLTEHAPGCPLTYAASACEAASGEPMAYIAKNQRGVMTLWWPGEVARIPLDGCELIPLYTSGVSVPDHQVFSGKTPMEGKATP